LTKNIHKLTSIVKNIKAGNFEIRAHIDSNDEVQHLAENINSMLDRIKLLTEAERIAIYNALNSQVKPHMIGNALDMVSKSIGTKSKEEISSSLSVLTRYLIYNMRNTDPYVTLRDELANGRDYLDVYNLSCNKNIKYSIDYDLNINNLLVSIRLPKFILQPLLENCIKHGFRDHKKAHYINITIVKENNRLLISVEDNGAGMDEETLLNVEKVISGHRDMVKSIGLKNIMQRMDLFFKGKCEISLISFPNVGTCVTLKVYYSNNHSEKHV
jgi:two-component system sensor histidine kinase YesM